MLFSNQQSACHFFLDKISGVKKSVATVKKNKKNTQCQILPYAQKYTNNP